LKFVEVPFKTNNTTTNTTTTTNTDTTTTTTNTNTDTTNTNTDTNNTNNTNTNNDSTNKIGKIALSHRPKRQHLNVLRENGCTHLCTLLCHRERAEGIGTRLAEVYEDQHVTWIWIPLPNAHCPDYTSKIMDSIYEGLQKLIQALKEGGSIVIHCSAGIHRTGLIANLLLRYLGYEKEEALQMLGKMRTITGKEVGDYRLLWADSFLMKYGTIFDQVNEKQSQK